jgi:hypothetical protein
MPNSGVDMVQYLFLSNVLLNWFNVDAFPMGITHRNQPWKSKQKIKFQTVYLDWGHSVLFEQVNTNMSLYSLPKLWLNTLYSNQVIKLAIIRRLLTGEDRYKSQGIPHGIGGG